MARVNIPVVHLGPYGDKDEDTTLTAADSSNHHYVTHPGGLLMLVVNNGSGGANVVTVSGVASPRTFERTEDITITTAAGERSIVGLPYKGYDQGAGVINIDTDTQTSISFACLQLVPTP